MVHFKPNRTFDPSLDIPLNIPMAVGGPPGPRASGPLARRGAPASLSELPRIAFRRLRDTGPTVLLDAGILLAGV